MIYLLDIYYRILYLFISIGITGSIYYYNKELFIFFIALPTKLNFLNYFIFIEPKEIFLLFLYTFLFFICILYIPYLILIIVDFLKPALYNFENKKLKHVTKIIVIFICFCYITNYTVGLPLFWEFFTKLKQSTIYLSFFFEIGGLQYFMYFISLFNILLGLQLSLGFYIYVLKTNIKYVLQYKKYIYTCIICFCTLITPPEIDWQIILFAILCICFECSFFFYFVFYETKKRLKR